eukprot:Gb_21224 [translate_table: standard]
MMDVMSAFFNGVLEEEDYMCQQQGFQVLGREHLGCRMRKAPYGLKQALRAWYIIFLIDAWESRGSSGVLQISIQSSMGRPSMSSFIATSSNSWLKMGA